MIEAHQQELTHTDTNPLCGIVGNSFKLPTLVLDLDETLVFSTQLPTRHNSFPIRVGRCMAYVRIRPGTIEFIEKVSQFYEVFFFTASCKDYANKIIDKIAPEIDRNHRLFRESCTDYNGMFIKDLKILKRPLNRALLVDDIASSGLFQPPNHIRILPWFGDETDNVLLEELLPLLLSIPAEDNIPRAMHKNYEESNYNSLFLSKLI